MMIGPVRGIVYGIFFPICLSKHLKHNVRYFEWQFLTVQINIVFYIMILFVILIISASDKKLYIKYFYLY